MLKLKAVIVSCQFGNIHSHVYGPVVSGQDSDVQAAQEHAAGRRWGRWQNRHRHCQVRSSSLELFR